MVPACTLTVTPTSGQVPLAITATGNCTSQNTISTTVLNFGDGTTANASSGSHTYSQVGTYTVTITATDVFGLSGSATQTVTASLNNFPAGIFVGVSGGKIIQFGADGSVLKTISTGVAGTVADIAFDKAGNLYTVDFTAGNVTEVNLTSGAVIGSFGSGYNCQPESMVFDGAGNAYVGQQGCSLALLKFDPTGKPLASFKVGTEEQGSDDLALSADECTVLYTSEGPSILRYDVCHNTQLTPFATGLNKALNLRILPDGGVVVADLFDLVRFNSSGQKTMTYTAPGAECLYGVALDQNGTSFWASDYCSSTVYHFDLNSGSILSQFNTGTPSGTVFGLAISGTGLNVAGLGNGGSLTASPATASLSTGQSTTFTVSFTPNTAAAGKTITLSCAGLPPGLSCSFNPPTITLGAAGIPTTATLTITRTTTAALMHQTSPWMLATWMGIVPAIVLAGFRSPRRRRSSLLWLGLIVASTGIWASCGGGTSMSQTTPVQTTPQGAYTVLVVGTGTGVQSSTTVTVTVQ
jgi:PKD repeat protein